jgi:hypothetical protein
MLERVVDAQDPFAQLERRMLICNFRCTTSFENIAFETAEATI